VIYGKFVDSAARLAVDAIADASVGVEAAVEALTTIEVVVATGAMDAAVAAAALGIFDIRQHSCLNCRLGPILPQHFTEPRFRICECLHH